MLDACPQPPPSLLVSSQRTVFRRTSRIITACVLGAGLAGAIEAMSQAEGPWMFRFRGAGLAAAFSGTIGLVCGLALAFALWLALRVGVGPRLAQLSGRWFDADPAAVARRYALGLVSLPVVSLLGLGLRAVLHRLFELQVESLGIQLAVAATVGAGLLGAVAVRVGSAALAPRLTKLAEAGRLPWPRPALLRLLLYLVLPWHLIGAWLLSGNHAYLVSLRVPIALALVAPACLVVWWLLGRAWKSERRRRLVHGAVAVAYIAGLAYGLFVFTRLPRSARIAEAGFCGGVGAALLRNLSDVDRDGDGSVLGAKDCAPFDSKRGPSQPETPGNGADEDCDGADAPLSDQKVQLSGRLEPKQVRRYNILWVIVDGVRADHTTLLGYGRQTTPNMAEFAKGAWTFERAYSQSSATLYSFTSMFTGANPSTLEWDKYGGCAQLAKSNRTLAERLEPLGYDSMLTVNGWMRKVYRGFQQGYDVVEAPKQIAPWKRWSQQTSPMVTAQAIEAIERSASAGRPFFVTAYYDDPHYPYAVHPGMPSFGNDQMARYDGEIAFADRALGSLLDYVRYRPGLWDDTVIVISADHGEEFGEHGGEHHAHTCYIESVHVPLVVRVPGFEAKRVSEPVALIDIAPTLLELTGGDTSGAELQGRSLLQAALARGALPERPIFCAIVRHWAEDPPLYKRSVRVGQWSLLHDLVSGRYELFDRSLDPGEKRNLINAPGQAERTAKLKQELSRTKIGNLKPEF